MKGYDVDEAFQRIGREYAQYLQAVEQAFGVDSQTAAQAVARLERAGWTWERSPFAPAQQETEQ